jgi:hypothetical protein
MRAAVTGGENSGSLLKRDLSFFPLMRVFHVGLAILGVRDWYFPGLGRGFVLSPREAAGG